MEAVAIIGMGCRFPGAPNPHAFWQLLCHGDDAITEVPTNRYDLAAVYDPQPATPGKVMSRYGGFLEQVDQFDAAFFGIAPREAAKMDPQHRLLMEVAWEAMEDAGQVPHTMTEEERLNIGCFIGIITGDYWDRQSHYPSDLDVYATTGSARSGAAGRISFSLDLMGTSFAIDAACSSSLVAVDQAVQNLRSGACTMAIAGGVNIILTPDHTIGFSQGRMMAADGHCKTYDAAADGYVRSEGVGVVVLKLLSQAQADGDQIYAVIRGCASNNDGHCASFMAPSTKGQQAGLRKACQNAGIDPLTIGYVEAHGPGTKAGDPIEITTLGEVLCAGRAVEQPLLVGSLKTNIGHMEGAAGVAGLIKAALCLKYGMIPANLHFHTPNPDIPWQNYALQIPTTLMDWPPYGSGPHRAVVCSYGIAGTNTYLVVEEAPRHNVDPASGAHSPSQSTHLLPLSAQTPAALNDLARRYLAHLENDATSTQALCDISATTSLRRVHHDYRLAVISKSRQEAHDKLAAFLHNEAGPEVSYGQRYAHKLPKVAWVFPGQGSQWLGMGRDLLQQEPVFRSTIEQCDQVMRTYVNWSLLDQLQADEAQTRLFEIDVIQPTLFAIEIALAALWRSWGMQPDVVVGHSMGEVAAAYIAGALSLEDAAWIMCARSRLLVQVSGQGAMAAVELSLEHAQTLISDYAGQVSVAVSNSLHSTVLSGDPQALSEILTLLAKQGIFGRFVNVDVASHSPQMDPLRADLLTLLERVQPRATSVPMFSTVNGSIVAGSTLTAQYWVDNLRKPVLFCSAIQTLLTNGFSMFLEMSPHPLLVSAIRQISQQSDTSAIALASLRRDEESRATLLIALGNLYTQGCEPNWSQLYRGHEQHVSLPTYPWQRQRHWNAVLDRPLSRHGTLSSMRPHSGDGHPILGTCTPSALQPQTSHWTATIDTDILPYLNQHGVHGTPVLPCAAYLELGLAAANEIYGPQGFTLENLQLTKALFLPKGVTHTLQMILAPHEAGTMTLRFFSAPTGQERQTTSWVEHANVMVRCTAEPPAPAPTSHPTPTHVRHAWTLAMEAPTYYAGLRKRGIQHGPLFQGITHIWQHSREVMAQITIPAALRDDMLGYQIHPALMDAILQSITPFLPDEYAEETYVPVEVQGIKFYQRPTSDDVLWAHAIITECSAQGSLAGDITLLSEQGQILLDICGLRLQSLDSSDAQEFLPQRLDQLLYTIQWEPQSSSIPREQRVGRKHWLIFSECQGLGSNLAACLRSVGAQCVLVIPGDSFRQLAPQQYALPPTDPQAFHRLFSQLYAEYGEQACQGIVYLWSMLTTPATNGALRLDQNIAESGILHLLQAQKSLKNTLRSRLWLVTSEVHAIEAHEKALSLLQAPVWGLGRVIVYEHHDLHTTLIDIDSEKGSTVERAMALFREIWSDNAEDEVALRHEKRYVARLVHHHLPQQQGQDLFRADSTYLITGGLGGVGLRTAQWMVKQGARHIVLLGRHGISQTIQPLVEAMRTEGAAIYPMQVDVSQEQQLARALDTIRQGLPPLRGVFHAAVVLDDGTLLQLSRERLLGVRPAKIVGAWNLHHLTLHDPLDYFVLFSSAASLIGSPGQGNYAAANAFLDQLAVYRRQQGYPALSISWGHWGEVGQATQEGRSERLDARGFASMKPTAGLTILGSLLQQSVPHIGVMSFNLAKWSQFYPNLTESSLFAHLLAEMENQEERQGERQRPTREMLAGLADEQCKQLLTQYLNDQIAKVLGHNKLRLDAHQQLNRLGIDSLMSVELKNRIGSDLNVSVPVTMFLQGISFEQFILHIAAQI